MSDTNCPYCNAEIEINHDDGYGYDESHLHQQQCHECNKTFTYRTTISFSYETFEAECLNNSEHDWKYVRVSGRFPDWDKMKCVICEEQRELTDEEKTLYQQ